MEATAGLNRIYQEAGIAGINAAELFKEIADWYVRNRREITEPELKAILLKHCESEEEVEKFVKFLETEPGQLRFKTLLREMKEGPIIHEATSQNPDPTQLMPIEVPSAFPEGAPSRFNPQEKAQIDLFINGVPDKNDTMAINYWRDWGDRKVYLEGWIDKCLAGTGFPPMEGGEWDEKIQYMVRVTHRTLIEKERERGLTLIEGGFREFEAGDKAWLYGVTWGVYEG